MQDLPHLCALAFFIPPQKRQWYIFGTEVVTKEEEEGEPGIFVDSGGCSETGPTGSGGPARRRSNSALSASVSFVLVLLRPCMTVRRPLNLASGTASRIDLIERSLHTGQHLRGINACVRHPLQKVCIQRVVIGSLTISMHIGHLSIS